MLLLYVYFCYCYLVVSVVILLFHEGNSFWKLVNSVWLWNKAQFLWFSDVYRRYKKETSGSNWLTIQFDFIKCNCWLRLAYNMKISVFPSSNYTFRNTRTRRQICLKLMCSMRDEYWSSHRVQYDQKFTSFSYFADLISAEKTAKYGTRGNIGHAVKDKREITSLSLT